VLNGKALHLPKPLYPAAAKSIRAAGVVNVEVTLGEDGKVLTARAVSGNPFLRQAAVDAARQARFSPTVLSGKPVQVVGVITYTFSLNQ
jgi:protein TonB